MKGFGFADTNIHIFFFIDDELADYLDTTNFFLFSVQRLREIRN